MNNCFSTLSYSTPKNSEFDFLRNDNGAKPRSAERRPSLEPDYSFDKANMSQTGVGRKFVGQYELEKDFSSRLGKGYLLL